MRSAWACVTLSRPQAAVRFPYPVRVIIEQTPIPSLSLMFEVIKKLKHSSQPDQHVLSTPSLQVPAWLFLYLFQNSQPRYVFISLQFNASMDSKSMLSIWVFYYLVDTIDQFMPPFISIPIPFDFVWIETLKGQMTIVFNSVENSIGWPLSLSLMLVSFAVTDNHHW